MLGTIESLQCKPINPDPFNLCLTFDSWQIRQDLVDSGIHIYPQKEYDEDPEERILNNSIRVMSVLLSFLLQFNASQKLEM